MSDYFVACDESVRAHLDQRRLCSRHEAVGDFPEVETMKVKDMVGLWKGK